MGTSEPGPKFVRNAFLNHRITRPPIAKTQDTYLTRSNCWEHCSYCTGWGAPDNKIPLAAAVRAVLGSAARRVTGAAEGPVLGWRDAVKGSAPGRATAQAGSGEASPGAAAGGAPQWVVGDAGVAGGVDAADGGLAVASLAPSGGDAGRRDCQQQRDVPRRRVTRATRDSRGATTNK